MRVNTPRWFPNRFCISRTNKRLHKSWQDSDEGEREGERKGVREGKEMRGCICMMDGVNVVLLAVYVYKGRSC